MSGQRQQGFTLLELIIATAITAALMAGLAAFLQETIATRAHLSPQDAWIRQLLLVNNQLHHELAGASFRHLSLDDHVFLFESRTAYRALPPGRYFYQYTFNPSARTLSLSLRAALRNHHEGAELFHGVVLENVKNVRFSALFLPPEAAGPFYWTPQVQTHGPASLAIASTLVAVRARITARTGQPRLPPLLYVLGTP
ncbi:prepilin-type N-terminal cleavage/methylation domain-containing protein [Acidiferrobacter sp.]|uniref:PulJ/GspJ family protein n=1 Tax=Acidiferrobacter sp. TaxID=1872107 RepID=UPI00263573B4|nr:prepilin-type N-terminal cleavage/methylation domain-containing protein [Acidiferrobacter sp.]